eukprot:362783-Chlamydomonas_euryale.AAC.9
MRLHVHANWNSGPLKKPGSCIPTWPARHASHGCRGARGTALQGHKRHSLAGTQEAQPFRDTRGTALRSQSASIVCCESTQSALAVLWIHPRAVVRNKPENGPNAPRVAFFHPGCKDF